MDSQVAGIDRELGGPVGSRSVILDLKTRIGDQLPVLRAAKPIVIRKS